MQQTNPRSVPRRPKFEASMLPPRKVMHTPFRGAETNRATFGSKLEDRVAFYLAANVTDEAIMLARPERSRSTPRRSARKPAHPTRRLGGTYLA